MVTCYYSMEYTVNSGIKLTPFELEKLPENMDYFSDDWQEIVNNLAKEIYEKQGLKDFDLFIFLNKDSVNFIAGTTLNVECIPKFNFTPWAAL